MGNPRRGVLLLVGLWRSARRCFGRTIEITSINTRRTSLGIFVFGGTARRNLRQRIGEHRGLGLSAEIVSRFCADVSHGKSRMEGGCARTKRDCAPGIA